MPIIFDLKDVSYSYLGKFEALKGIDLAISQGEQVSLIGTNGSGKSTLLSILDALMAVRPVVATRAGGIPEIIEDGKTGLLVPPRDHVCLAEAIVEMLEDPQKASQLASTGHEAAVADYTSDKMVEGTIAVYEKLLKKK